MGKDPAPFGASGWRRPAASRLAFLVDAERYFGALADALERAREQVLIVGWDVHSRTRLRRDEAGGLPSELGPLLDALARRRRRLRIHVLDWDYSVVLALGREWLPVVQLDWRTHPRVEFCLDPEHPVGACHHQKIVVIDDRVAFSGGLDLTLRRWDASAHAPDDPRRVEHDGRPYDPFHDVQVLVEGEAARDLGDLARTRWRRATGSRLRRPRGASDPWPRGVEPDVENVRITIARSEPAYADRPEVREIESSYLAAVAAARRFIYVENQYLTAARIADVLAARLREPSGPEVVVVAPETCTGWLEEATMGSVRASLVSMLRDADRHDRFRLFHPVHAADPGVRINVHAKVMVVDDRSARVGSANLSNRSMGFDTECDVLIEDDGRTGTRRAIASLRDRLLAEHLGSTPEQVAAAIAEKDSLIRAIEALAEGSASGRSLRPLECAGGEWLEDVLPVPLPTDPPEPLAAGTVLEKVVAEEAVVRRPLAATLAAVLALLAAAALWRVGLVVEWTTPGEIPFHAARLARSSWAFPLVLGAFAGSGLLFVPLAPLVVSCAWILGPLEGFLVASSAAWCAALFGYAVGRFALGRWIRSAASGRFHRVRRFLPRRDAIAVAAFRWIPSPPFALANLLAGAHQVPWASYAAGSALELAPRALALCALSVPALEVVRAPSLASVGAFVALAFPLALADALARRALTPGARYRADAERRDQVQPRSR